MDKSLDFLTKDLIDKAAKQISVNGVPPKREGTGYAVEIDGEHFPFKLLITEAAKLANVQLKSDNFGSSEFNRSGFEKLTNYKIITTKFPMDYFDIDGLRAYAKDSGMRYESDSKSAKCYFDTRSKLQFLGSEISKINGFKAYNNYNEKPNKQAGQGKGFVLKEYILTGFAPSGIEIGNRIFVKLTFHGFDSKLVFAVELDVNFKDEKNKFRNQRDKIQGGSNLEIPVDESFPDNWNDLIEMIDDKFILNLNKIVTLIKDKKMENEIAKFTDVLTYKKQIILQGPPGTGKTYTAKDIAEMLIYDRISTDKKEQKAELEKSEQFELVQFHPSYSYEDFVRGISVKNENGNIEYITENKVLAAFAARADENRKLSLTESNVLAKLKWTQNQFKDFVDIVQLQIDEEGEFTINPTAYIYQVEHDAFRYKGRNKDTKKEWGASYRMKFSDIIEASMQNIDSRAGFKTAKNLSGLAKQHATYFYETLKVFNEVSGNWLLKTTDTGEKEPLKKYVLIIDEINRANLPSVLGELIYALEYRGEKVSSMYALDGDNSIVIPDNLYIVGTMNTADRSVGHIDYAIKRRFAFMDVLPTDEPIQNNKALELFEKVNELFGSQYISSDFEKKDVQLGHSYFILNTNVTEEEQLKELSMKLKYEIIPILREYVKDGLLMDIASKKITEIERFEM